MGWGDELMVTGHARALQARDPRKVRVMYEKPRWSDAWDHNPRIARPSENGEFQNYRPRVNYLRPYCEAKEPNRWRWRVYGPPVGELYFTDKERLFAQKYAGRIVLEPKLKPGAPVNKDWGWARWEALAAMMKRAGLAPTQIGLPGQRLLAGVEFIATPSVRFGAALLSTARAAVLPEGGLHHAAAAVGCPAVVIFGGYIAPAVTGYRAQRNLFVASEGHALGCGMRTPCAHCAAAMAAIPPAQVFKELEGLIETGPGRVAA